MSRREHVFINASAFKTTMAQSPVDDSTIMDDFVNIRAPNVNYPREVGIEDKDNHGVYRQWVSNSSARHSSPGIFGYDLLRKLYPNHAIVSSKDYALNILGFPGAYSRPLNVEQLITNVVFIPLARRIQGGGVLLDSIEFGCFRTAWANYEFTVYIVKYLEGFSVYTHHYIIHDGEERPIREMLLAAGSWSAELHEEIWVYNQGWWNKDHELWSEVQKADWSDIILEEEFKSSLKKDVFSFFTSEDLYKKLAIPWKRGLILYGPPGNGKTISIKAIMKTVSNDGYAPLYVKSFQNWQGEEAAMQQVFDKARQCAPCVIILEDLDSLINDRNRSFFLNQMDGLSGNDGLLVIASTNHFDRLDPGLSTRPSRFDRKYLFDDPTSEGRCLYTKYWQEKLSDNDDIDFPDSLATEIVVSTSGFSFAYLKEAFVSALVTLANDGDSKGSFADVLRRQIKALRKQLEEQPTSRLFSSSLMSSAGNAPQPRGALRPNAPGAAEYEREQNHSHWETGRSAALSAIALGRRYVY